MYGASFIETLGAFHTHAWARVGRVVICILWSRIGMQYLCVDRIENRWYHGFVWKDIAHSLQYTRIPWLC